MHFGTFEPYVVAVCLSVCMPVASNPSGGVLIDTMWTIVVFIKRG